MPDLETQLRALAEELAWPATPDLAAAVARAPRERRRAPACAALAPRAAAPAAPRRACPAAARPRRRRRVPRRAQRRARVARAARRRDPPRARAAAGHAPRARGRPRPRRHARAGATRGRLRPRAPARARPARPRAHHRPADLADLRAARRACRALDGRRRRADPHRVARRRSPASTCRSCCSAARTPSASGSAARRGAFISGEHAYLYETPDGRGQRGPAAARRADAGLGRRGRVHRLETAAPRAEMLRIARSIEP